MAEPTHATIATFRIDLSREAEQTEALHNGVVPGVREHPGVVSGTWTLDRDAGETTVLITYDSAAAAEAMVANVRGNAENQRAFGLELLSIQVVEVVAAT
jgi:hypothetical protein